jgi:hypothetical protein
MVKNVGEPGGGPFLAFNEDGSYSPQILESSQIDPADIFLGECAAQSKAVKILRCQKPTTFTPQIFIICSLYHTKQRLVGTM